MKAAKTSSTDHSPKPRPVRSRGRSEGFTLIELMIVVALIGVLAAIAMPTFRNHVYRAMRSEAELNLKGIYQAQYAYHVVNGDYGASFLAIGFEIAGGQMLDPNTIESKFYTYTLETFEADGIPNSNYSAVATGDLDRSDAMLDILMIESGLIILD